MTPFAVSPLALCITLAAGAAAGMLRGFAGFGSALVMAPPLSAIYGARTAVPATMTVELVLVIPLLKPAVGHVDWPRMRTMAAAAFVSVPAGAWALTVIDPEAMRWVISAIVLAALPVLFTGWRYKRQPGRVAVASTGALSGALGGATGLSGPPVVFFYLAGRERAMTVRASLVVFFAWVDVLAVAGYGATGSLTSPVLLLGSVIVTPFVAGGLIGARWFTRASEKMFRRVALGILVIVAIISLPV